MTMRRDVDKSNDGYRWRRFFARNIDLSLYAVLWSIIAYLALHWNITGWTVRNAIIGYALMMLIEPFMLNLFGTTPGKAIFGILIKNAEGQNLTLSQGYRRIWGVFGRGYGYGIPIYSIIRNYKSYAACEVNDFMEWDYDAYSGEKNQYTISTRMFPLRAVFYLLSNILLIIVLLILPFAADMPRHRGELSKEQFLENVERYARFHNMLPIETERMRFIPPAPPPGLTIIETNGVVTEISFEIVDGNWSDLWGIEHWIRAYVVSFVGAQEGVNFWNLHIARGSPLREFFPHFWPGWGHSSHHHIAYGIEMIYEFDADWNTTQSPVNLRFSLRKMLEVDVH